MTARTRLVAAVQSSIWHRTPQAAAIIARLHEAELARVKVLSIPADREEYQALTDRAGRYLDRLDALRTEAVNNELGYTYAATQSPYDEARCIAWLTAFSSAPSLFEALRDEFAARAARAAKRSAAA